MIHLRPPTARRLAHISCATALCGFLVGFGLLRFWPTGGSAPITVLGDWGFYPFMMTWAAGFLCGLVVWVFGRVQIGFRSLALASVGLLANGVLLVWAVLLFEVSHSAWH